ncbi:hypothetical protein OsI_35935 [Oryza sativa Indica Group]|uniref:Uncharacterized protein n=1 Tax=Oryza sativa subsp. indica TaxID=39946 RepID=B8BK89_ORYSI|nr:hypothetical protein OsI_35935 [Oryza sativa Indica Group]
MDLLCDHRLDALLLLLVGGGPAVEVSIHTYDREPFREVGNAFLLSGGSEGVVVDRADLATPASSFIPSHPIPPRHTLRVSVVSYRTVSIDL